MRCARMRRLLLREGGPRVLQKTTKEDRVTSYGPGFARSSKSHGEGTGGGGGLEERRRRGGLKSPGSL